MPSPRFAVVLAGGRGERFWPLSRASRPKQLMPLPGGETLLARTVGRLTPRFDKMQIFVVTSASTGAAVADALTDFPPENIIEEPIGRSTAPAVALAAVLLEWREAGCAFAVLPSDHHVGDVASFHRALDAAFDRAESGDLVTFGIRPRHAATGYGYIRRGPGGRVAAFKEKPDAATARQYVTSGEYLWNSGMFVWRADAILNAIGAHAPAVYGPIGDLREHLGNSSFPTALRRAYEECPTISIDYAVMEKASNAAVIEADFDWDDIGAWDAFLTRFPDAAAEAVRVDSDGAAVVTADPRHTVAVVGLPNVLVVHTPDATLVVPRDRAEDVRRAVQQLRDRGAERHL